MSIPPIDRVATVRSVMQLWIHRDIGSPAETVWELLTTPSSWPDWGPTVRSVDFAGSRLTPGASGRVKTLLGLDWGFEVTTFVDNARWAWKVAGLPATDHTVSPLGPNLCRAGMAVPWPAAPYLAVCRIALRRLDVLARQVSARDTTER